MQAQRIRRAKTVRTNFCETGTSIPLPDYLIFDGLTDLLLNWLLNWSVRGFNETIICDFEELVVIGWRLT